MKILRSVKILSGLLKHYKKEVIFLGCISLITSLLSGTVPYIYGKLVDAAINKHGTIVIISYLGVWAVITAIINVIDGYSMSRQHILAERSSADLILKAASHITYLPISFHKDKKIGTIMKKIDSAANYLAEIIIQVIFGVAPQIATIVFALLFLFSTSWQTVLIVIALLIAFIATTFHQTNRIIKNQGRINRTYEYAYGEMFDVISNASTVKENTNEKFSIARFKKYFWKGNRIFAQHQYIWRQINTLQALIAGFGFIAVFGTALFLLDKHSITVGQFTMIIGYMSLVYKPFWNLTNNLRILQRGTSTIERALKLFDLKTESYDRPARLKQAQGNFSFQDVSFAYKTSDEPVLKNISFEVKQGDIIALVGESGVGKSTFVSLLSNYYSPTSGKILLDGIDIRDINLKDLRKNIAIVPQEATLFNDTIGNNIRYGRVDATDKEIRSAAYASNAHEFIESFPLKYNQIVGERGIKLSTGQKQRVAIARALLRNPKILIFDEATSALDSQSEKLVQEALERLTKGKTTFIIAHRLSTIRHANKILVFDKGEIVQIGTHKELIHREGIYKHLCSLQHVYM